MSARVSASGESLNVYLYSRAGNKGKTLARLLIRSAVIAVIDASQAFLLTSLSTTLITTSIT